MDVRVGKDGAVYIKLTKDEAAKRNEIRDGFVKSALIGLLSSDVGENAVYWKDGEVDTEKVADTARRIANQIIHDKELYDDVADEESEFDSDAVLIVGVDDSVESLKSMTGNSENPKSV